MALHRNHFAALLLPNGRQRPTAGLTKIKWINIELAQFTIALIKGDRYEEIIIGTNLNPAYVSPRPAK
jgi:hypothetical protein